MKTVNLRFKLVFCVLFSVMVSTSNALPNIKELKFESPYYEAVDQMVLVRTNDANEYLVGYIYIDQSQGFTLEVISEINILSENDVEVSNFVKEQNMSLKIRLGQDTGAMHILTEDESEALDIPSLPEWMSVYKDGSETVPYMKDLGYHYNHVGASHLALDYLTRAYELDPEFDGLLFELAFAYNATKQYDTAIELLANEVQEKKPKLRLMKEYGFALVQTGQVEAAEKIYRKALKLTKEEVYQIEFSFNLLQGYFNAKNKKKFNYWFKKFKKHAPRDSQMFRYAQYYQKQLDEE